MKWFVIALLFIFSVEPVFAGKSLRSVPGCEQPGLDCVKVMLRLFQNGQLNENNPQAQKYIRMMWENTLSGRWEHHPNDLNCSALTPQTDGILRCPLTLKPGSKINPHGGGDNKPYSSRKARINRYLAAEPWSAAFMSSAYLGCVGDVHHPSLAQEGIQLDCDWHADYIYAMHKGLLPGWRLIFNFYQVPLKEGDLVCNRRSSRRFLKSSHCDVVFIEEDEKKVKTYFAVGGNINNSVRRIHLNVDSKGILLPHSKWWVVARPTQ